MTGIINSDRGWIIENSLGFLEGNAVFLLEEYRGLS